MVSIHVDLEKLEWKPGSAKYGAVAVHEGEEIIQCRECDQRGKVVISIQWGDR